MRNPRDEPYWLDSVPSLNPEQSPLPAAIDVAVVGSGVTGLNAALELRRGGRSVVLLDSGRVGQGASTRNAGFVGRTLSHSFSELLRRHGLDHAVSHYRELHDAFSSVRQVIEAERLDCDLVQGGRIILARSNRQLDRLTAELELRRLHLGWKYERLDRRALLDEVGCSKAIVGGVLLRDFYSIHPGKYCAGLLSRILSAGAQVHPFTHVSSVARSKAGSGFVVGTSRGSLRARNVLIATNGYTGPEFDWLRRRLVPFPGFMMATGKLPRALLDEVLPHDRTYTDTNFLITAIRRSPGGDRLLVCGRPGQSMPVTKVGELLRDDLTAMLPDIGQIRISRAWNGYCCGSFDRLPKLGSQQEGIHFAIAYLFNGIPLGTHLGRKAAWQILGMQEGASVFSQHDFTTVPLYRGRPWFLPAFVSLMALKDRMANSSGHIIRKDR